MKVAVGGMIGCGKSSLMRSLSNELGWQTVNEFDVKDDTFLNLLDWCNEGKVGTEILLQTYFIDSHYKAQMKIGVEEDVIVDRFIFEHAIFAQQNLKGFQKDMYYAMMFQYVNVCQLPDKYIILEHRTFDDFKARVIGRDRAQEMDHWEKNQDYYKSIFTDYTKKLTGLCDFFGIEYDIIKVDKDIEHDVVLNKALNYINCA